MQVTVVRRREQFQPVPLAEFTEENCAASNSSIDGDVPVVGTSPALLTPSLKSYAWPPTNVPPVWVLVGTRSAPATTFVTVLDSSSGNCVPSVRPMKLA